MQNGWNLDFDFIMDEQETPANRKISPARGKLMLWCTMTSFKVVLVIHTETLLLRKQ